ncbi:MAG: efflux RND transporter periplasmic adaptor subunit [Phycisphaerales bacterium]
MRSRTGPVSRATLAGAIAATSLAILAPGCGRGDNANAYVEPPPPEVIVAKPVQRDVTTYITYTGVVEASATVDLTARVRGYLQSMHFEPGQRVEAGDLLFVIDPSEYQAAVERGEAIVRSRAAALEGAENDARLARELADQRAGPEIDALIKAARRDAMVADLAAAEADLVDAKLNLQYTEVRAPISGRVTVNYVDVGNLVGQTEPTLLASIVQASPAYVPVDVSESDVVSVRKAREQQGARGDGIEPGQIAPGEWRPSELALANDDDFSITGRIDYVEPQLNVETGTLRVRTRYENEDDSLIPGMFTRVRFAMSSKDSLLVPESALLSDQQGRYALVVNSENTVEIRRVQIGALDGSMRVVEQGLSPDDRVIVLGALRSRPGSKVTPKTQQPSGGAN